MKKLLKASIFSFLFLISYSAHSIVTPGSTASDLTKQYYNTSQNCGGSNKPAFICSGVMLRGTLPSTIYHSWDPSPSSIQSGGVSFSYLRKDSKFRKLAYGYNNGFIFYPHDNMPAGKVKPEVLCSFPIDADSFNRAEKGCGRHNKYPAASNCCQAIGVRTSGAWKNHYTSMSNDRHQHQCGFDVNKGVNGNATYFYESIKARALISTEAFNEQNELRLATWQQGIPAQLPIQAFFYVNDGLRNAQYDQRDYYNNTGLFVPVIRITLPKTSSDEAKFNYLATDQSISP